MSVAEPMIPIQLVARPLLALAVALTAAPAARAETVVQDVTVTASFAAECHLSSANIILDFGEYDAGSGTPRTANAPIFMTCNAPEVPVVIRLDSGLHAQGGERRMAGGPAKFLRYNLYTERAGTLGREVWGDGAGFGQPREAIVSESNPYSTVHGEIPSGQEVAPGVYSDTVMITVTVNANLTQ